MGLFLAILAIYCILQLNCGGNNGMFTKLKAIWFEAQYGEGVVVRSTRDCLRPHSGIRLRVTFRTRILRKTKENSLLVRVPREFAAASEAVQNAVLAEILGREGISVSVIESIEEAYEAFPDVEETKSLPS